MRDYIQEKQEVNRNKCNRINSNVVKKKKKREMAY